MIQRVLYILIICLAALSVPSAFAFAESSDHFLGEGEFSYYEFHNNPGAGIDAPDPGGLNGFEEGEGLPEFRRKKKDRPARHTKYFFTAGVNGSFRFDTVLGGGDSYTNILGGVTGSIRFGMKGVDFNWSIEQQFGHIWGLKIGSGSADMTRYDASTFVEMTQIMPLRYHFCVHYTLGVGLLYNMPHTGNPGDYRDSFAIDDAGTNLAVSAKLGVGIIWYFTPTSGFGLNLNYMVGMDIASYLKDKVQVEVSTPEDEVKKNKMLVEMLQPGVLWIIKF